MPGHTWSSASLSRDWGTLYCSVLFFSPDGALMGKHRKLMPTAAERLVWGFGDGSTMPVLDTPIGRIGAVICWENYMPLLRMHMYSRRIQIYCARRPTIARPGSRRYDTSRSRAVASCWIQSVRARSDYPTIYPAIQGDNPDTIMSRGGSCIIDPLGRIMAGPDFDAPSMLVADLNLDEIPRAKFDFDVVGHYARPDVFRLIVGRTAQDAGYLE